MVVLTGDLNAGYVDLCSDMHGWSFKAVIKCLNEHVFLSIDINERYVVLTGDINARYVALSNGINARYVVLSSNINA